MTIELPLYNYCIPTEIKDFFRFLLKDKLNFTSFLFFFVLALLLPGEGYYWQIKSFWQPPKVSAIDFSVKQTLYPINETDKGLPFLTARSFFVFDPVSSVVLASKNERVRLPPASTTKMMTALVSLGSYDLNQVLTVPDFFIEGRKVKLVEGEQIVAENLLIALLVGSANDAAEVLARNYSGGRETFVEKMNEKSRQLFLENTHFTNPTGIDQAGHFSTAHDLAWLARYALESLTFARIVSYPKVVVSSIDGRNVHSFDNVNQLLAEVPGVRGVKTGWTLEAGECLVAYVERDGKKMISVVLGSSDRFGETKEIISWVFENFTWREPYSTHFGSTAGT